MLTTTPFTPQGDQLRALRLPGSGEEVLYLHGLGCHGAASWAGFAVLRGRPALIPDLPGHGRSDRPIDFDYTLPAMADAVAALLWETGGPPREIVAHSLGGSIAIHLSERHPELVRRLVLVEPAIDVPEVRADDIAMAPEEELEQGGWDRLLAREIAGRRSEIRLCDPRGFVRCARSLVDHAARRTSMLLTEAAVPIELVVGEHRRYADQAAYESAGIRTTRLDGAGHFVMHDAPEALLATVGRAGRGGAR